MFKEYKMTRILSSDTPGGGIIAYLKKIFKQSVLVGIFILPVFGQTVAPPPPLPSKTVDTDKSVTMVVKVAQANVREHPAISAKILFRLRKGNSFTSSRNENGWVYYSKNNRSGWIHTSTVETLEDGFDPNLAADELLGLGVYDPTNPKNDEWFHVGTAGLAKYSINPSKIRKTKHYISVWIKLTVADSDKKAYWQRKLKNLGIETNEDYDDKEFSHSLLWFKMKCDSSEINFQREINYWNDGRDNGGMDLTDLPLKFKTVVPESNGEAVLDAACKVKLKK